MARAFTVLLLAAAFGLIAPLSVGAAAPSYSAIYVFGDSYSDNGAGFQYSNGPPAVEHMARRLGRTLVPANAATGSDQSLDFAVSGAETGADKGFLVSGKQFNLGMLAQVNDFAARVRAGTIKFSPDTTLFFLAGGFNDRGSAAVSIGNLRQQINTLASVGAVHIRVALLPVKIAGMEKAGLRLNAPIAVLAETFRTRGIDVRVSKWGMFYDEVYENAALYRIVDTRSPCAGVAIFGEPFNPCPHPEQLYFYYSGHPSAVTHQAVGDLLAREMSAH